MNQSEVESKIETLREQMVQMYLVNDSINSGSVLELSQKLDVLLNCYENERRLNQFLTKN